MRLAAFLIALTLASPTLAQDKLTLILDWFVNPDQPNERFKATVYILDSRLRADGLNVAVFKQVKDAQGNWTDAASAGQTETDLENAILTKARQLRLSNIG